MTAAITPIAVHPQSIDQLLTEARSVGRPDTVSGPSLALDAPSATPEPSFERVLMGVVDNANRADASASRQVDNLSRGISDDLHGTMIATREAGITIHLVGSIRSKLLDAFNQLWHTSV